MGTIYIYSTPGCSKCRTLKQMAEGKLNIIDVDHDEVFNGTTPELKAMRWDIEEAMSAPVVWLHNTEGKEVYSGSGDAAVAFVVDYINRKSK